MEKKQSKNTYWYAGFGILIIGLITFIITVVIYSNTLNNSYESKMQELSSIKQTNVENTIDYEQTGMSIGKTVEEVENETINQTNNITNPPEINAENKINETNTNVVENLTEETKKELSFAMPVNGEVIKEFSKDNLSYSETLKEWVTHNGIDIQANETTIVKAAEARKSDSYKK